MATETKTSQYRRATEFTKGLGSNLDIIEGKDVLIHEYIIEEGRKFGDGTNTLITMQISTLDDPENKQLFHAWSDPLATRFQELTNSEATLPLVIKFVRAKTSGGFKVWTIE